ncbi:hypothetical protein Sdia_03520 [Streptomyces diastaticus subsp. diastaticus]|uniref:Uncharacterized protein n=2 Tax=Streptomyces TaxID=1883 RepID=A0A380PBJ3_STRGR|nr:hypothetical protein Sdia_03520 [Streptomyces diastaticus subsp. diastaticus]GGU20740.1 hypothetical protein GCM10015534_24320 [Streptomyces diastaticus subsp. diastaticus]SUP62207.1 Uncharacterised protein [Streptomyces griseus]
MPGEPWFRRLCPAGYCVGLPAVVQQWLPLTRVAALFMGTGMGLSDCRRWKGVVPAAGQVVRPDGTAAAVRPERGSAWRERCRRRGEASVPR